MVADPGGGIEARFDDGLRLVSASATARALLGEDGGLSGPVGRELRLARDSGAERRLELEVPTAGGLRWLDVRLAPEEGGIRLEGTDVTDRVHAELRLSGGHAAFRALVEDSPDPVARVDAELRIGFVNSAFERAVGRPAAAFLGRPVSEAPLPDELAERWEDGVRSVFERGERLAVDFRFPAEGGPRWYSARLLPEPGPGGAVEHVISSFADITDRVNQEAEQAALRRVATVVAREGDLAEIGRVVAEEASLLLGATGSAVYRFESPELATCVAAHPAPAEGVVVSPTMSIGGTTATGQTARTGEPTRVDDYAELAPDPSVAQVLEAGLRSGIAAPLWAGGRVWGALTAGSGEPRAFGAAEERRLAAFAELAAIAVANAEARAELARLAETDALTGLANRRAFTKGLAGEVERARRHGHLLTLVILDLDGFKSINDTHGHQVGDRVLAEVGRHLAATSRAGELVARIGGEEFAWVLPQVDAGGARAPVERARAAIAGIRVEGVSGITCSAGICDLSAAGDVDELQRRADRALYQAKRAGRDRVEAAAP